MAVSECWGSTKTKDKGSSHGKSVKICHVTFLYSQLMTVCAVLVTTKQALPLFRNLCNDGVICCGLLGELELAIGGADHNRRGVSAAIAASTTGTVLPLAREISTLQRSVRRQVCKHQTSAPFTNAEAVSVQQFPCRQNIKLTNFRAPSWT